MLLVLVQPLVTILGSNQFVRTKGCIDKAVDK